MMKSNQTRKRNLIIEMITLFVSACAIQEKHTEAPTSFSGIYPHLAYNNNEGECGTGAVVPWADKHSRFFR